MTLRLVQWHFAPQAPRSLQASPKHEGARGDSSGVGRTTQLLPLAAQQSLGSQVVRYGLRALFVPGTLNHQVAWLQSWHHTSGASTLARNQLFWLALFAPCMVVKTHTRGPKRQTVSATTSTCMLVGTKRIGKEAHTDSENPHNSLPISRQGEYLASNSSARWRRLKLCSRDSQRRGRPALPRRWQRGRAPVR